jgi:hypothetical protein
VRTWLGSSMEMDGLKQHARPARGLWGRSWRIVVTEPEDMLASRSVCVPGSPERLPHREENDDQPPRWTVVNEAVGFPRSRPWSATPPSRRSWSLSLFARRQ